MKRIATITITLLAGMLMSLGAAAQTSHEGAAGNEDFHRHWFIGVRGGIGQTVGETSFGKLVSPAAGVNFGYRFTPVWGLRAGISGWQAKGAVVGPTQEYKYNYLQGSVDAMVDICNIFADYKMSRTLNPYLFAGIGINGAFDNSEAMALASRFPADNLLWEGSNVLPAGRFGAGLDIRLVDAVHFNIEIGADFLGDSFNSKRGSAVDWQLGATAGLTFNIGMKKGRKVTGASAASPAASVVPQASLPTPASEETPADKQPADNLKAEAAPAVVQEEPAPAQDTSKPLIEFETIESDILFTIGNSVIRDSEKDKIDDVVAVLKANPNTKVIVTGHADAETGSENRNLELSKERAENVASAIIAGGISSERVTVRYKGDKENPYDDPARNRVAICVIEAE